jgi:hypothetical protein
LPVLEFLHRNHPISRSLWLSSVSKTLVSTQGQET